LKNYPKAHIFNTRNLLDTKTSTMNAAIALNNQGVQRLREGDYRMALSNLKEAAELMYLATKDFDGDEHGCHTPAGQRQEERRAPNERYFLADGSAKDDHLLKPSDNIFFIHDTPFTISSVLLPNNRAGLTVISTIVLYNMSLTYHLSSCQCSAIPHAQECATTLYKMACSLAMKHKNDELMIRIAMASMNNLGCLHFEWGNFESAKEYLDALAQYLVTLGANYDGPVPLIQRNELMLNVIILRNPHAARAA
jgi:tetratricopeptide (TPR) repeat protein